ncbi:MAG: hypothetical protein JOZ78_15025 [Chroococcidiopsidaceae cyanobacterium CP_BM_ER_R8_30]|nr:hypothetical protein [Chroococcidiopsidaceae cyanobacterium CP_BM_ER_R8_30]
MVKLKRRQLLLGGIAAGVISSTAEDYWTRKKQRQHETTLLSLAEQTPQDTDSLLQAAFEADNQKIYEGKAIQAALKLTNPTLPYSREMSKLLIQCSKIATQQYLTSKTELSYDGSITKLPAYTSQLDGYTQIASFKGKEAKVEQTLQVEVPNAEVTSDPLEQDLERTGEAIGKTVKESLKLKRQIPVYLGFILSSKRNNIIVFRGTQTQTEWLNNFTALQKNYTDPVSGRYLGKVHRGFINNYLEIVKPLPRDIARQLDPSVPCYITGHSLGAALATLAALDLALNIPQLHPQLHLYTYASPRVGDPTFALLHSQTIPNNYRVINLADAITLMPPTKAVGVYVHVGQEWSFLSQEGDLMPNHVVDTYRTAVESNVETDRSRTYPTSGEN